jgi:hypothetical protein
VDYYLLNAVEADEAKAAGLRELAAGSLGAGLWGIGADEPHRTSLAPGDLVLIYLGAPDRVFLGRAELASEVHAWTESEARDYRGDSPGGVLLAQVEEWDPPVPMHAVLARIGPSTTAKADFQAGVVRITASEYEAALAVAAGNLSNER